MYKKKDAERMSKRIMHARMERTRTQGHPRSKWLNEMK